MATLARVAGLHHLALAEDAVQAAFTAALETWTSRGVPEDPGAWLYRVAHNRLVGDLRRRAGRQRILEAAGEGTDEGDPPPSHFPTEVRDDMLRMLFVCCHDAIPLESRLVLALKTLCGFDTAEIALRLFTTEANVHKRLARARDRLRAVAPDVETPPLAELRSRLPGVHAVLYLLFNEGYLAAQGEEAIRRELCEEAIRLATLLGEHPVGAVPESFALLALMHLHAARLDARVDGAGGLLLLEEQDRSRWDRDRIQLGLQWLARGASGDLFSRLPRRGRHRRRALPGAVVPPDALAGDRRAVRDAGADRAVAPAHAESRGRHRRVARAGSRAGAVAGAGASGLVGGIVSVGGGRGRPAPAGRKARAGSRSRAAGARTGAHAGDPRSAGPAAGELAATAVRASGGSGARGPWRGWTPARGATGPAPARAATRPPRCR